MTTRVNVTSNVDDVIDSIDDVEDDIRYEMRKRVNRAMSLLEYRATQYVMQDANYRGGLAESIHSSEAITSEELQFKVATDSSTAPYAAIVEYGSGDNTNRPWVGSESPPPTELSTPRGFPYSSPDITTPPEDDKYNLTGYPTFAGFVGHIEEWMQKKPVTPNSGDLFVSAVAIAYEIASKGNLAHPFMRPAWFDTELRVRKAAKNALKNATR